MKKYGFIIILALILGIGTWIRSVNLSVWPREGATFDEFAWTFQGLSIITKGVPTSWSPHSAYTNRREWYNPQGAHFVLVTPYLEHPPLFGLVAGGFAYLEGIRDFSQVTIAKIRPLALFLGVLSIIAVFLLGKSVYGTRIGLLASSLYTIVPTVAIGSRLVQNENFFIPLFLLSLYFANEYTKKPTKGKLVGSVVLSSILPLAKVPWVAAPMSVILLFLIHKRWKEVGVTAVSTLVCFSGFLLYGFMLDSSVFTNLWKLQMARYDMAFDSLFALFRNPLIADRTFVDGWIYFGWAAMIWLLNRDMKKTYPLILGFLAYFAVYVFAIPNEPLHGWYRYPFYPFLILATASMISEFANSNYFLQAVFFVVIGSSMLAESWTKIFGFSYTVFRGFLFFLVLGTLPVFFPKIKAKKLIQRWNYGIYILLIFLSVWSVFLYNEQ